MRKHIVILLSGLILLLMACEQKNNPPSASFTHTSNSYETGDTIRFTSTSLMADAFEWDFGDGDTSTMENPWHIYNSPDDYPVTLKVTNTDGAHEITENILVKSPTILGFVAYDSAFEKTIPLTEIWLYETRGDWYNMENEAYYGQTDLLGEIRFYNVKPIYYWVDAYCSVSNGYWYFYSKLPQPVVLGQEIIWELPMDFRLDEDRKSTRRQESGIQDIKQQAVVSK